MSLNESWDTTEWMLQHPEVSVVEHPDGGWLATGYVDEEKTIPLSAKARTKERVIQLLKNTIESFSGDFVGVLQSDPHRKTIHVTEPLSWWEKHRKQVIFVLFLISCGLTVGVWVVPGPNLLLSALVWALVFACVGIVLRDRKRV